MSTLSMWKFRASLLAAALAIAPLTPMSHAQDNDMEVQVNVPFGFEEGAHHFQAGLYTIRMPAAHFMSIQGTSGFRLAGAQLDMDLEAAKTSKVVFRRYGDKYFLEEVWIEGGMTHIRCIESKAESLLQTASKGAAPKEVELALLEMRR